MAYIGKVIFQEMVLDDFTAILAAFVISVILFLAMMIYYKIRILKLEQYIEYLKEQNRAAMEVGQIARKIEEDLTSNRVVPKTASFEDEQETKAIISYDELLKKETKEDYPYKKPEVVVPVYSNVDTEKQIKLVSPEIRESAIKEKPIVRENKEFLNSLVNLRSNLK